jgi:hypothetical protein
MTDHDGAPGTANGVQAELETRRRLAARRALAEEAEAAAVRAEVEAEAAEAERQAAQRRQLEDAQERAHRARERAAVVAGELAALVDQVGERVRELRALKGEVDRGADHEQFAARAGIIRKLTVITQLPIEADLVTRAVQVGRELAAVGNVSHELASIRAAQRMA